MKKICIVTATRAEYGLLRRVIDRIYCDKDLELQLVVTGTHLSDRYGNTLQEILEDGYPVAAEIDILDERDDSSGVINTLAKAVKKFGEYFEINKPDMLVVLGDRYEIMGICEAAMILKIPIAHISGGEITEGALDDTIRHCITKMSHLHFPGCEEYRRRIIQLGEQPEYVFNYGDVGVENILSMNYIEKKELEKDLGFPLDRPYGCVTMHPTSLDGSSVKKQIQELLIAIDYFDDMKFIFTGANADAGGRMINEQIRMFVAEHDNCRYYDSLGIRRFLSLLRESDMMIGNSSSGIVEAPCFGIPTVNIGDRQRGRLQADSIINCEISHEKIIEAVKLARTNDFKERASKTVNPYGTGKTSEGIVKEIKSFLCEYKQSDIVKKFYDIQWNI